MFDNNISYLVGSANAKLADDIKKIQRQNNQIIKKSAQNIEKPNQNRITNLFCNNNIRQSDESIDNKYFVDLNNDQLDFTFVKINCKKEMNDEKKKIYKKIFRVITLTLKFLIFVIIGSIVGYSIYRIIELNKSFAGLTNQTEYLSDIINNTINIKRSANVYSSDKNLEWSVQKLPSIYEIEPLSFYDSNNDGFGDLIGIIQKLDYIKNSLSISCILLKNLNSYYDIDSNQFIIQSLDTIDHKIGNINDLKRLIDLAHYKSMRVLNIRIQIFNAVFPRIIPL